MVLYKCIIVIIITIFQLFSSKLHVHFVHQQNGTTLSAYQLNYRLVKNILDELNATILVPVMVLMMGSTEATISIRATVPERPRPIAAKARAKRVAATTTARTVYLRGGTETNRQCFADICKSRQSRFGSKSGIYCWIDALKTINTAQRHVGNKHRQLILPICTTFIANLVLPTLADIGNALPISLCAVP